MAIPSSYETGFWELDNNAICQELSKSEGRKWKQQSIYSEEDRHLIAKRGKDYGASQAVTFFKNKHLKKNESTV